MELLMPKETVHLSETKIFLKRIANFLLALLLLTLLLPLLIVIALITKLSSKGTIIYKQERIGLNKVPFTIYKFRSMYINAEKNGPLLSKENDTRITQWGKFMRRFKIDELPQLLNIIKGNMNFVGPRPERKYFINLIEAKGINYSQLLKIKPGLTSAGMVNYGYASSVEQMIDRLQFDIDYMNNASPARDFKILMQTIAIVCTGKSK
jgi:lipopolysaccharide/colanic/teichoic acid biosynthesis glycosyltransferase